MSDVDTGEAVVEEPATIVSRAEALWQELQGTIQGMSQADLEAPGQIGTWSGKDLVAHIGHWYDAAATVIDDRLSGRPRGETYDDFEAWNARWAEEDRALSVHEAQARCTAGHDRLLKLVDNLPADRWDKVVRGWVNGSGVEHLEEHIENLRGAQAAERA